MSGPFNQWANDDLADLIAAYPLAWINALGNPSCATPMPLLLERDAQGRPQALLGHLPRAMPIFSTLQDDPRAQFLFRGPHAYIAPEWISDARWAPTWNFAVANIQGMVSFDENLTDEALARLVGHMENGRPAPCPVDAMGERYALLKQRVVGFRASVTSVSARFKLGQDERPEVFEEIMDALGEDPLASWMARSTGRS